MSEGLKHRVLRKTSGVLVACVSALWTLAAEAACLAGQDVFSSCRIAGKGTEVRVCFDDQVATYSYGVIGKEPDLVLSESVEKVDFVPWPGLGRSIYESVRFYNGDYSYQVGGGFERPFSDEEAEQEPRRFGWVEIAENGSVLARLDCIPETVSYGFGEGLYDLKTDAGLAWDEASDTWIRAAGFGAPVLKTEKTHGEDRECLPPEEFRLGGVGMGDPVSLLAKLGSPEASGTFTPSGQAIDQIVSLGIKIQLVNDVVIGAEATRSSWDMPSGLKVGMTRGDVIQILGSVPGDSAAKDDEFSVRACDGAAEDIHDWYAVITFGQDKRVDRIVFSATDP